MKNEIIKFISKRWKNDCHWLDGNCYYFSLILCHRFPNLQIYYLPIDGHFVAGDGQNFYDWTGELNLIGETIYKFSDIEKFDDLWYERIVRDCVL